MKLLATVAAVLGMVAVGAGLAWHEADRRADAAMAAFRATDSTFQAYRDSIGEVRVARADSIRIAQGAAAAALATADSIAAQRPTLERSVDHVLPSLPDSVRNVIAAERASFLTEIAALRTANDSLRSVVRLAEHQILDYATEVARVNARLAEATRGWELAERARRPSVLDHVTKGLALVGLVTVADRALCGFAGSGILLPCGS